MRGRGMPVRAEASMNFLRSWCRNSNTKYSLFSVWMTSNSLGNEMQTEAKNSPASWEPRPPLLPSPQTPTYLTIFGWLSSFSREISRMAVLGTPSVSLVKVEKVERESWLKYWPQPPSCFFSHQPLASPRKVGAKYLVGS